jgi:hypothetical protein
MFRYTNPDSNTLHLDFFSRQVGGNDECNRTCKKKCKKNCSTFCNIASEDKEEFREAIKTMKEKKDALKEKLKEFEIKEKEYDQKRIKYLIDSSWSESDRKLLSKLKKIEGGTRKKRRNKKKSKRGGFSWFEDSSLQPCKKSCFDKCESTCKPICSDASFSVHNTGELTTLQNEIKFLELSIDTIKSKLNL